MSEKTTTTAAQWKRRAERAESRYQQLRDEVQSERVRDMSVTIELADSRYYRTQARVLLVEAIELLDSIADADTYAQQQRGAQS